MTQPWRFAVVVAAWNAEPWIRDSLDSIAQQTDDDFTACVVVDQCEDLTDVLAAQRCENYGWPCIVREKKMTTIENQLLAIHTMDRGNPEDVIVFVDGDDRLTHPDVFTTLRAHYADETRLTYGSYESVPFSPTCHPAQAYPPEVIATNSYREYARTGRGILWNHLRTFKYELFNQLGDADFRDDTGHYGICAPDAAFMFPCLELARGRVKFIHDVLLSYNSENPLSEWRKDPKRVNRDHDWILSRPVKT